MNMEIINSKEIEKKVEEELTTKEEQKNEIAKQAEDNVNEIMQINLDVLEEKRKVVDVIEKFGLESMQVSAKKNSLLKTTIGEISKTGEEGGVVSNSLADLHREIKDLDPSLLDFSKQGILGKFFNPIRRYFDKYQKADSAINDIIKSLDKGKTTLVNDNVTLEIEEESLRDVTKKLKNEIELGIAMDSKIDYAIQRARAEGQPEEKIKFVSEEILFPLRQRIMDMQQMTIVNQQGIVAMEVVRRNNKELIRGVDRAKNVTITALRTAVMVASSLYNQKVVLTKIEKLNEATENIISSTSQMIKEQGTEIQKQSSESMISPETLKEAFQNVIIALDDISAYKQESLVKMAETVAQFKELAENGEKELKRLEQGN